MFDRLGRTGALIVILVVGAAVLAPALWGARVISPKGRDSFPLSWYPMFSREIKETILIHHVVGFDSEGNEYRLPYTMFTKGGMNEGRARLNRMARARSGKLRATCKTVAGRLGQKLERDREYHAVERVEVVLSRYNPRKYFTGEEPDAIRRTVKARCPVPGGAVRDGGGSR